ncbi:uracil-DNA glycosylase family protein [Paraneptunicella aestuarii]|uniref:uracil-DNA glycosylase family protein n=1 Tax=Paraneptunicella aestuarii TaxID=2831148 RepID=UPI001E536722|nr:uracil-DNA glycosylase family protein [Paraneptunicella aestuarii]UAA39354.1 uracil-DNA glycosylase family protein [Paraneptunicella aestuarii]
MRPDKNLLKQIRQCTLCESYLPKKPTPVLQFSASAKIMIVGQAPGIYAHNSQTPWNDASGRRLREWLNISDELFYDTRYIAIVPMGFCYPGKGKSGDLPPRPECAKTWHSPILDNLPKLQAILLIGQYAQHYYLGDKETLTTRCRNWKNYWPKYLVLPHPSPRNNLWLRKNPWFEAEVIPEMQRIVQDILKQN